MNWYACAARFLGGIPEDYLVFDTETQAVEPEAATTLPVQIGFALVKRRKLVESGDFYVNWTIGPFAIPAGQLAGEMDAVAARMAKKGKAYRCTYAEVVARGVEPTFALREFRQLVVDALAGGFAVAAHNGFSFDCPLMAAWWRRAEMPLQIPIGSFVDTGLMEKCYRMGWSPPAPGSCVRDDWYARIAASRSRVRWSLDDACDAAYGLRERHGLDPAGAHTAGYDAIVTHHLLEAMRSRAEEGDAAEYRVDIGDFLFPIGKEYKGRPLRAIAATPRGRRDLEWFLRQSWFLEKFAGPAATVEAFLAETAG